MHVTILTAIGRPGEFERSCDRQTVVVGLPTPVNSPVGGGVRIIPDRTCVEQQMLVPAGACDESTAQGTLSGLTFDDPCSLFNGVRRVVDVNENQMTNARGPVYWFTDPFGKRFTAGGWGARLRCP